MTQKYYTVEETAKLLGVTPADVNRMREQRELFGVNTGVSWKFKVEDVEKLARDRQSGDGADDQGSGDEDVLLSEAELGESDPVQVGHGDRLRQGTQAERERHPARRQRRWPGRQRPGLRR